MLCEAAARLLAGGTRTRSVSQLNCEKCCEHLFLRPSEFIGWDMKARPVLILPRQHTLFTFSVM